jgi:hypothetical protein
VSARRRSQTAVAARAPRDNSGVRGRCITPAMRTHLTNRFARPLPTTAIEFAPFRTTPTYRPVGHHAPPGARTWDWQLRHWLRRLANSSIEFMNLWPQPGASRPLPFSVHRRFGARFGTTSKRRLTPGPLRP